jgi:ubiquinone/menaquinone biosynthesis C-methylase UbiE
LAIESYFVIIDRRCLLDLGAGTGLLSQPLLTRFPDSKIICLDFAQEALKKNPTKNKLCADANHLPLSNNCVDIIISNLMMQWCGNLNQLFSECHRVLKNDGLIFESGKRVNKGWDSKPVPAPKSKTISVLPAITSNFASRRLAISFCKKALSLYREDALLKADLT